MRDVMAFSCVGRFLLGDLLGDAECAEHHGLRRSGR